MKTSYYERNKEQIKARRRAYYQANSEKEIARSKAYYERNKHTYATKRKERYDTMKQSNELLIALKPFLHLHPEITADTTKDPIGIDYARRTPDGIILYSQEDIIALRKLLEGALPGRE